MSRPEAFHHDPCIATNRTHFFFPATVYMAIRHPADMPARRSKGLHSAECCIVYCAHFCYCILDSNYTHMHGGWLGTQKVDIFVARDLSPWMTFHVHIFATPTMRFVSSLPPPHPPTMFPNREPFFPPTSQLRVTWAWVKSIIKEMSPADAPTGQKVPRSCGSGSFRVQAYRDKVFRLRQALRQLLHV